MPMPEMAPAAWARGRARRGRRGRSIVRTGVGVFVGEGRGSSWRGRVLKCRSEGWLCWCGR